RGNGSHVLAVDRRGKKGRGWRGAVEKRGGEFIRKVLHVVEIETGDLLEPVPREERTAGKHEGSNGVKAEFKGGHDAEVSSTTAKGPEQVRVFDVAGRDQIPICGHDLGRHKVVGRAAMLSDQPRLAAAPEREPRNAGRRDHAAGRREPERLRLVIEVAPERAALGTNRPSSRIDVHAAHPAQVDDKAIVADGMSGNAVSASAYGNEQAVTRREVDGRDGIC